MAFTNSLEDKLDRGLHEVRRTGRRVARDTRHAARDLNADVKDDVRSLVEELEDLLKKEDADVDSLRKRLHSRLDEVRGTLDDATDDALYRLRAQADRVSQAVHENPWQTAGVVAGLAFIAGLLLARR
ncbi:DUF883 family protein [Burkholderia perseverans]|jgi:ElaB/YqjD/DUF883 family membrane-anchored ribosome-binding protein|uniref:DUF883 family protein n=1 Tax=Burkholderia perseverans TaxID=2615214 RepID=UPI001FF05841|nr:DUF883 family protein [Burkholderia perseverans]